MEKNFEIYTDKYIDYKLGNKTIKIRFIANKPSKEGLDSLAKKIIETIK